MKYDKGSNTKMESFEAQIRKAGDELCAIVSNVYRSVNCNPSRSGSDLHRAIENWKILWNDEPTATELRR